MHMKQNRLIQHTKTIGALVVNDRVYMNLNVAGHPYKANSVPFEHVEIEHV